MRFRFLHMADSHLGYRQYNLRERFNDFTRAFQAVVNTAIAERVDFVLLAGDLFQKRAIDALTLDQAMGVLEKLKRANIPCIAVEGNHEHAYYDEAIGWVRFLAQRELLVLLDAAKFSEGKPTLAPYRKGSGGSYIEPLPGVRVHGLRYLGSSTGKVLGAYAAAMDELPRSGIEYNVFVTHAGLEGVMADEVGGLSARQLAPLRPLVDYLALGHIHKPFEQDEWVYNPGSLETCSSMEAQWPERGYYLVDVDTSVAEGRKHRAVLRPNPRRQFHHLSFKVDSCTSPDQLYGQCDGFVGRKARDHGVARLDTAERPVVTLNLNGVLAFDRGALDLARVEAMVKEHYGPLHLIVQNQTRPTEFAIEAGDSVSRPVLERHVLAELFSRDARFREQNLAWARTALGLKNLVLEGASPEAVIEELESHMEQIERTPTAAPHPEDEPVSHADPVG